MRTAYVLILVVFLVSSSIADDRNELISDEYGITIQPPTAKEVKTYPYTMVMFYLPVLDGFSANVNVQKQIFEKSLEDYDKVSLNEFRQLNATLLQHKIHRGEILYEITWIMNGKKLHGYSRAIKQKNFIYLITATGLDSYWEKQKAELMKSVNSFKLTK